jgi:glucokinase
MNTLMAGDIGGTKTTLALYPVGDSPLRPLKRASFPSRAYGGLTDVIREFLAGEPSEVEAAAFGVAGPVMDGAASITNLTWVIDEKTLASFLDTDATALLNDLVAVSYGITLLSAADIHTLNPGRHDPEGPIAVIAPGTGLGEAYLTRDGVSHRPYPSEGGHADFAPCSAMQVRLLGWMLERHDHVSVERVCSGSGIPNIYAFLKEQGLYEEPGWLAQKLKEAPDPTVVIREAAQDTGNACELCRAAMRMFVEILGAEAGNLSLKLLPTGGLYIAGGLAPRMLSMLEDGTFMEAFSSKGRLSNVVGRTPVHVVLNTDVALMGAASYGMDMMMKRRSAGGTHR